MSDLPEPLVPPQVDLRGFPFMPLHIHRLRTSRAWMRCKRNPALGFYMVNLWTAAWHSKPAGSLEDDAMALADAAMCSDETFAELRDDILHGWIKCSDGRLYHRVVAETVTTAWGSKCARKAQTDAARKAREAKRRDATSSVTDNVPTSATTSNREGEGERYRKGRSSSLGSEDRSPAAPTDRALEPAAKRPRPAPKPRKHPFPDDAFARWYDRFPRKKARQDAEKAFRKIEAADDTPFETLLAGIEAFARDNPDVGFWPYPASWLNGRRWLDESAPSAASAASVAPGGEPRVSFGGGVAWPESMVRRQVDKWRVDPGSWPEHALGPPPNAPGCRVPNELLRMAA